jgi:Xaa-Pro dipeptidase
MPRRAFLKWSAAGIGASALSERRARIDKARRLMTEHQIDALLLEGGSSLFYFTEDCVYITEGGAKFFTQPSPAIDRPFV